MNLIEREDELATLEGLLTDCQQGSGRTALVSGAEMTGKTALLHALAVRVHQSDAILLSASASRAEQAMPLGVLSQLFGDVSLSANDVDCVTGLVGDCAFSAVLYGSDSETFEGGVPPVARRLWKVLRELADERPVVICIDDMHYADTQSLQCLMYFVRRMGSARILMVLNECTRSQSTNPVLHAELMRHPYHVNIRLAVLSFVGVAAMLTEHLDAESAHRLAPDFYRVSGGNPLLVHALLDDHRLSTGRVACGLAAGDTFGPSVRSCLYRCEIVVQSVARGLAILGDSGPPSRVGRLVGLTASSVAVAMERLNMTGLLDAGRYRHEKARAAVLDGMDSEEQAEMHCRAAQVLHDDGAASLTVARHLIAGNPVEATWVVPILQEAAEQALFDDEVDLCIQFLRVAHRACRDEQRRISITSALARAEWRVDPSAVRRYMPELTGAVRDGLLAGCDRSAAIGYLMWEGRPNDAVAMLDAAPEADAEDADAMRLLLSQIYPGVAEHEYPPTTHVRKTEFETRNGKVLVAGRPVMALFYGAEDRVLSRAEQILQETPLDDKTLMPIVVTIVALIYANWLDSAASWSGLLLEEASVRRAPVWQAIFAAIHAMIDIRRGELAAAREHAQGALTLMSPKSWGVLLGAPLASMILATTVMGGLEEAATYLRVPVPEAMLQTPYGLYYLQARGRYHLATRRFYAALTDFKTCGELMVRWRLDFPALVPWRSDVAQAYIALGREADAKEMVKEQLARLRPGDARTRGISLRIMAATAELQKRPRLLREAVGSLQLCGNRLELALALADMSCVHQALGQYSQARLLARRAARLADKCGAEALRRKLLPGAEPELEAHGQQPDDRGARLSGAELRVAARAADGYTNRQISKELYVTVSTVEQHLTRVYRKLGVNRRDDLASVL